jgi:hypothetical protein
MGFRPYPYQTTQAIGWAKEMMMGDPLDATNVFQWSLVRLNLPGLPDYDPRVQWVSKIRKEDGRVAADLFICIDDFWPTVPYEEECWRAARKAGSTLNFLGPQEASLKCRPGSMTPGPWAGSMAYTDKGEVRVLIAKKKWDKGKRIIGTLVRQRKESPWLDHKELERWRGFLIYLSQTYPPLTPLLLGLHQTIDGWRPYRHEDGWKIQQAEIMTAQAGEKESGEEKLPFDQAKYDPPQLVAAADRLQADLNVLGMLTSNECPPLRRIRASSTVKVLCGFGDASKGGFG